MTILSDEIERALKKNGFEISASEGRLMLAELLLKAGAGYRSSHTEEAYLYFFGLLKADRSPNKKGREFLCSLFYNHSNRKPAAYNLMRRHRLDS